MRREMATILLISVLGLTLGSSAGAEERRVSGTVLRVDAASALLVVEAFTAATGPEPIATRRTVGLGPDTRFELVHRVSEDAEGWANGYLAAPFPRDFVTVAGERHGDRLWARRVWVVRPEVNP
jgi:hypothetical protein